MLGARRYDSLSRAKRGGQAHGFDHSRLKRSDHVGERKRDNSEAKLLVEAFHVRISGVGEQFELAKIIGCPRGCSCKGVDPAGISPVQKLESPLLEPFLELIRDACSYVVKFLIGIKHQGNLKTGDPVVDLGQPGGAEGHCLDSTGAHLSDHFRSVAQHAPGIDLDPDRSLGDSVPFLAKLFESFVPGRVLGSHGSNPDPNRLSLESRREEQQTPE